MAHIPTQLPLDANSQNQGILEQTLGQVLKSNPQAQNMVMQSMHISPEKFQQLLTMTNNNGLMNTKIKDLFTSGIMQQALAQQGQNAQQVTQGEQIPIQVTPEQLAQMQAGDNVTVQAPQQKPSMVQKLKTLFGL